MQNVLISGSTGFVGSYLTPYLQKQNKHIISVGRDANKVNTTYTNLHNNPLLNQAVAFIHLAGKAHDLKKVSDDSEYYKVNTELTKQVYNTFLNSDCEVFIFISSVKATADRVEGVLDEQHVSTPQTAYGKSKMQAEEYILNNLPPSNKKVYILRPCMIHGPGNKGNLNLLYSLISKGVPYPLASYHNQRSFLSVENLCYVINSLIMIKPENGVYHIADDKPLSTNELVSVIAETLGKKPKLWKLPKWLISIISKIGNILPLPLNEEKVQKLTENYVVSNQKIKTALNSSLPLKTKEGLKVTISSFEKS